MARENLARILAWLYPNADPFSDWAVQDEGGEPYIARWNLAGVPQPTDDEVMAHEADWRASLRRLRTEDAILTDFDALTATERNSLWEAIRRRLIAGFLRLHPRFAQLMGINLSGDEPEV
jgi:hypothetical protein